MSPISFLMLFFIIVAPVGLANTGESWNLYLENDSSLLGGPGSDSSYTSGLKLSYNYGSETKTYWSPFDLKVFEYFKRSNGRAVRNYSLSLGHQIFTPEAITAKSLNRSDRPYAGWLYLGIATAFKYEKSLYHLDLSIGVVGPSALGRQVQSEVHRLLDTPLAMGWANQLNDEPTVQIFFQHKYNYAHSKSNYADRWIDIIPFWGVALGNVYTHLDAGVVARLGYKIPNNFGPSRPSATDVEQLVVPEDVHREKFSFFVFSGFRVVAVARNIFLDGNSFRSSHRVDKRKTVGEFEAGITARYRAFELAWRRVYRSAEFEEMKNSHSFVTVNLAYIQNLADD